MSGEGQNLERKSLRVLEHPAELAKGCVAFANARGGLLLIGIEDGETEPPQGQRVRDAEIDQLRKRMSQLTVNAGTDARRAVAGNGGEYIELQVFASVQSIAATSDGRYYIRVADESHPLMPDELSRLMSDKTAFSWESHRAGKTLADKVDAEKQAAFWAKSATRAGYRILCGTRPTGSFWTITT
jgi:ATP-dependent DNA helicase RecG